MEAAVRSCLRSYFCRNFGYATQCPLKSSEARSDSNGSVQEVHRLLTRQGVQDRVGANRNEQSQQLDRARLTRSGDQRGHVRPLRPPEPLDLPPTIRRLDQFTQSGGQNRPDFGDRRPILLSKTAGTKAQIILNQKRKKKKEKEKCKDGNGKIFYCSAVVFLVALSF
ncbi:uncharacterized protein LOC109719948 isoform X1 [Ananas comosus]|uniref:Uncharacterized protein LOC109719948 isoform X1 n=1 Tax=Ananas comosus TaxID=4615 RepID=A0A6P5G1A0_ANACO|nr:uncharacterized protein LOC109719948 isoform X1 [Ananas comosus]